MSFLLASLYYKLACLVAKSFLQPLVCLLLFQVASVRGSELVKESLFLTRLERDGVVLGEAVLIVRFGNSP